MDPFQIKSYILKNFFTLNFKYYQNLFICDWVPSVPENKTRNFNIFLWPEKMLFPILLREKKNFPLLVT